MDAFCMFEDQTIQKVSISAVGAVSRPLMTKEITKFIACSQLKAIASPSYNVHKL